MSTALLQHAVGYRHGLVPDVQVLPTARCEVRGVWHASVAPAPESAAGAVGPPAGGVGWAAAAARDAAVGEALERYAGAVHPLAAVERASPACPWTGGRGSATSSGPGPTSPSPPPTPTAP